MGCFLNLFSSSEQSRFVLNTHDKFVTRIEKELKIKPNSTITLQEISFKCSHEQFLTGAKLEIIDWLYYDKITKKYGKKTEFDIDKIDIPDGLSLANLLNYYVYKAVPAARARKDKVFSFDREKNVIWVSFPAVYYYSLRLHGQLLSLVGWIGHKATPSEFAILGRSKKDAYYVWTDKSKRYFNDTCKGKWESAESHTNFFEFSPSLADISSLFVYSNVCADVFVASSHAPLLRIVPLPKIPTTRRVTLSFGSAPQRIPIRFESIQETEILIRDINGERVQLGGYTRVCLLIEPPQI